MITFEKVTEETKAVVEEMFSSNCLEVQAIQYCIKVDDTYIGLIDYMVQEEKARLSVLIVHNDYQGYGYGTNAYFTFEEMMKHRNVTRIEILQKDLTVHAKAFIEGLGFEDNNEVYMKHL
ncbi:GNAT family N-acetyltransferase [Bacillus sp. DX4.1]|uniref:GNAT family N-acetyltransferase n=1 Tax=Bacillus sp. DX4.1 TaxID=3055867 RepID=UPI0025A27D55|nr:GNAT family N-acetyltransferase [Bacillus sp. DX4.1]MDM5188473.1 GNAT family N-acetyltransferase [Bacillus sp. DX4.1]